MTTVTVAEPYQVVHEGVVYPPGSVVDVPDEVAQEWLGFGWVEKAKPPPAKAAAPPKKQASRR